MASCVVACGGGASAPPPPPVPTIQMVPRGDGWSAEPLSDSLTEVSNNGLGYTGEIDRYEMVIPATGTLHVSLSWEAEADYDLILAADDLAELRLVEGLEDDSEPEYVTLDVVEGQHLFVFVAGWDGEPGPYLLEAVILPPGAPPFTITGGPDLREPWPANRPLTFSFTTELDPSQGVASRVYLVHPGGVGEGTWCVDGADLTFYPRLPETPGDRGGLVPGERYTLQFPRAARGLRAATGEYLAALITVLFDVGPAEDLTLGSPWITGITPSPGLPYHGEAITLALSEPLDPKTVAPELVTLAGDGSSEPLPFTFQLTQQYLCSGAFEVRLLVAPDRAPPAGSTTRLLLPGAVLGLSGEAEPGNAVGRGAGIAVDFRTP